MENSSASTVTINLTGEFTATALESIIRELANARAGMKPEVPSTVAGAAMIEAHSLIEHTPAFQFSNLINGGLRIHLRSSGLGWLAFELTAEQKRGMLALLSEENAERHHAH